MCKTRKVISVLELDKEYLHSTFYVVGKRLYGNEEEPVTTNIEYHEPAGEGDQHYCDIYFSDGLMKRVFRPESISFEFIEPVVLPFEV